jgi:peptide/nickel transport system substrate-binding protein
MTRRSRKPGPRASTASSPGRHRITRRDLLRVTAAAGLGLAVSRYAGRAEAAAATPQRGGTLRVGWVADAHTFDPHFSVDWPERPVMYAVYNTLVAASPTFDILPELGRSWKASADGLAITVELQPDVKFHDGTSCDAAAVKWNMDFILDPANNSPQRKQLDPFLASVEAAGPATVVFHLKKPYAGFLAALTERPGFIVSPAAWKKYGKDLGRHPVGTGMYQFVEWLPDDHVTVRRFDGYWDRGKPYLDGITYKVVTDPTVRDTMVRTGELDITSEPDPKDVPVLQKSPGVKVVTENPSGHWWATQWRVDRPPFNNKALRQAIAYGVDREEFVKVMLGGRGSVAKGPTPSIVWWYNPGVKGFTYDPNRAKQLLAEAGYANGFQATFATDNNATGLQFAQLLQAQLRRINVDLTINPVNPTDLYQQVLQAKVNWARTDWTLRADPDGLLRILFYTGNYANSTRYSNPTVDKLLDEGNSNYDRDARKKIYAQIDQQVIDDIPYVWFFYVPEDAPMRANVQNYVWIPDSVPRYRDVWLAK